MDSFIFTREKSLIVSVINNADKFLKILCFQFTDDGFIRRHILNKATKIPIEIITLPIDSYKKKENRKQISQLHQDLENAGAKIHIIDWEVGDPSLTTTSQSGEENEGGGDKWYSMHGKFIFSEKEALMMTANLTDTEELESYLLLQDKTIVQQFSEKFLLIKELFIDPYTYHGNLYEKCTDDEKKYIADFYSTKGRLNIKEYPPCLISEINNLLGLKVTPFDGVGREYLDRFINAAKSYIYLSTERLADEDVINTLINKKRMDNVKIKIMTCRPGQQRDKKHPVDKYIFRLISEDIDVVVHKAIHAKCWISDDLVGIGSLNLGQMNLGIDKGDGYWRANTETFYFTNDRSIISQAKQSYENFFLDGENPIVRISKSKTYLDEALRLFTYYGAKSSQKAREKINQISISQTITNYKNLDKVVLMSVKLAKKKNDKKIEPKHALSAIILFILTEREHTKDELFNKLSLVIDERSEFENIISDLFYDTYIEMHDGKIQINIAELI